MSVTKILIIFDEHGHVCKIDDRVAEKAQNVWDKVHCFVSTTAPSVYMYIYTYIHTCYSLHITYYKLPIDCLFIALGAHKFSHIGHAPQTKVQAAYPRK